MQSIVCKRAEMELSFSGKSDYKLLSVDGIGAAKFAVATQKNSGQDGEYYLGSTADKRNIVIVADINRDYQRMRDELYAFFQPREYGELISYEDGEARKISYYAESVNVSYTGTIRTATISLLCPDPLFRALEDERTEMAMWEDLLEWPVEFGTDGFEITRRYNSLIKDIENPSNAARGLTVVFRATAPVINPSLFDIGLRRGFKVQYELHAGDEITVTTGYGNKRVKLTHEGVTTNINHLWVYGSAWLQAEPGITSLRYDAESGLDNLDVTIFSAPTYWGG